MKFDELNRLRRFFSTMEISEGEKEKRVSLGKLLYDAFFYVFLMMKTEVKVKGEIDKEYYKQSLDNRIRDALKDLPYDEEYIPKLTDDVIETTERHLEDEYYFSKERALLVAQNESNTVYNSFDYQTAKKRGKKYKRWQTEKDSRVRLAHEEVDDMRIPIDEYFHVGNDNMLFPHDYLNGSAENLVNCRCTCIYE